MILQVVWLNGHWISRELATISIDDRGFLFGDGIFTTIKVEDGRIFFCIEHLQRLEEQCRALCIIPPKIDPFWLMELVDRNNAKSGLWRIKIILSAAASSELHMPVRAIGTTLITISAAPPLPQSLTLGVFPYPLDRPLSAVKSLAHLDRLLVRHHALEKGWDDAIVTCSKGFCLESAFANIFWLSSDTFYTPDRSLPLLKGVFLSAMERAAAALGLSVKYVYWNEEQAKKFPLFCCNSIWGAIPVTRLDREELPVDREILPLLMSLLYSFADTLDCRSDLSSYGERSGI